MAKRLLATLLIVLMLLPALSASAGEGRVVRVGWIPYPNTMETDESGVRSGYNYDYLMEIQKYTGWTYEFVDGDLTALTDKLIKGEIDLLGSLFYTEERAKIFDFSELDYGNTYTALFTKADSDIGAYDFERFDGMSIATMSDSVNNTYLEKFASDNGFTYKSVTYSTTGDIYAAVRDGRADAGILAGHTSSPEYRVLAEFAPLPCYFATTKGNKELQVELNRAMNKIKIANPSLEVELYNKHFTKPITTELTAAEKAVIEASKATPIKVGITPSGAPLCYYDKASGEYRGVYIEILREISEQTGLVIDCVTIDLAEGVPAAQLKAGKVDLVAGMLKTQNFEDDIELAISESLADDALVLAVRKNNDIMQNPTEKTIALRNNFQVANEYALDKFPEYKFAYYDTLDECISAVAEGRADALLYLESCVNYLLRNPHYENLEILSTISQDVATCVVGRTTDDSRLISIVDKGLAMISESKLNGIMINYTILNPYQLTMDDLIYKYRFPVLIISLLFVAIVAVLVFVVMFKRASEDKLKKAFKKEQSALAIAEQASVAKGNFMSRMSHEIRTPLNAVIGYNSIARSEMASAKNEAEVRQANMKVMDCLTKSDIASKHLLTIINDVLDMSAIETGKIHVAHEIFDFKGLISSLTVLFFSQARSKGVGLEVIFESPTEEWYVGDQMRVNQILTNLLSNAVKFTAEGGSVRLAIKMSTESDKSARIHFSVTDTGIGMSKEYLTHIWTPFEQGDATISRRFGGTGLGLSITKSLIDLMGGSITVDSTEGVGTTFDVELDFERAEQPKSANSYDFAGINALVVDDDRSTCDYMKLLFDRCGARCNTVCSGNDAVGAITAANAKNEPYTLCLIDWRMPDMDGVETVRRLRELTSGGTLFVIVTAYDYADIEHEARAAGVDMFATKPIFQSSLFDLLANISGKYVPDVPNPEKPGHNFDGARVLLVEDNAMNMEIAKKILASSGLTVDSAWNGKEAVAMFESSAPGGYKAILMDIQMPEMDGYEATRIIRGSARDDGATIPILAMTADAFAENVASALAAGMNGHIAKPIDIPTLFETLESFIK